MRAGGSGRGAGVSVRSRCSVRSGLSMSTGWRFLSGRAGRSLRSGRSVLSDRTGRSAGVSTSDVGGPTGAVVGRRSRGDSLIAGVSEFTGRSCCGKVRTGRAGRSSELSVDSRSSTGWLDRSIGARAGRAGRTTAPVGRASEASGEALSEDRTVLGSRPFRIRARRKSLSRETPGVRAAAPVCRSVKSTFGVTRAGRVVIVRPPVSPEAPLVGPPPLTLAGLRGRSPLTGSAFITRRANA